MSITTRSLRLQELSDELAPLFPRNVAHWERARKAIPGGGSRFRFSFPFPIQVERAVGARLWDIDGREYVDGMGGFGPMLLGHSHPAVVAALSEQVKRGLQFGAPNPNETELSELIIDVVPGAEGVMWVNSGSEAGSAALRLARFATGKNKVAKFEGCYHGWHDALFHNVVRQDRELGSVVPTSLRPDIPTFISDHTVVLSLNDPQSLETLRERSAEIACVFIELIQGSAGFVQTDLSFAQQLRAVCDETGVLLVIDEVLTGFRCGITGASGMYGIEGDLVTLGKVVCGGLPGAAIAGRADLLGLADVDLVDRDSVVGHPAAALSGTHAANVMSMTAGKATLEVLIRDQYEIYPRLFTLGERLRAGLQEVMDEVGFGFVTGEGPLWGFHGLSEKPASLRGLNFGSGKVDAAKALGALLLREGVFVSAPPHLGYLSAAHTEEDIDHIISAHRTALSELRERGFLE